MLYIYHHQGIGDHIIFNGLMRKYSRLIPLTIFCFYKTYNNIKYMYRDNKNINLLPLNSHEEIDSFLLANKQNIEYKKIGFKPFFEFLHRKDHNLSFDECFYKIVDEDFTVRFDNFYIERNDDDEQLAYNECNPDGSKYIYVHDDPSLNFVIDKKKHRHDLKIIYNNLKYNIFQMRKILENATEIHTMQTGMFDFCNSIKLNCPIFVHLYVRKYPIKFLSKGINSINLIY